MQTTIFVKVFFNYVLRFSSRVKNEIYNIAYYVIYTSSFHRNFLNSPCSNDSGNYFLILYWK